MEDQEIKMFKVKKTFENQAGETITYNQVYLKVGGVSFAIKPISKMDTKAWKIATHELETFEETARKN